MTGCGLMPDDGHGQMMHKNAERYRKMKILLVADNEDRRLWDNWSTAGRRMTEGVNLILSAGDIRPGYLDFLVSVLNVPCLYVRGNHDGIYDDMPPAGCIDIDGKVCEITFPGRPGEPQTGARVLRIAGLGGSMRYHEGKDMYTEKEMSKRVRKLLRNAKIGFAIDGQGRKVISRGLAESTRYVLKNDPASISLHESDAPVRPVDIFLTHAPSFGHGDLEDLPHHGFACFNDYIAKIKPHFHCYGHVHMEYGLFDRVTVHPSGTSLINVSGMYILEI